MPKDHDDTKCDYEPIWNGRIKYLRRDSLPSGLFWSTYKEIEEKENIRFKIHKDLDAPKLRKEKYWIKSDGKYSFQNDCVNKVAKKIKRGKGGLIINATGSGKTRVAAMTASRFDCDFLFVVDQLVLLRQARKDIKKHLGEEIGYVGESKFKIKRFTVATRQTLALHRKDPKFAKWFENVDVIFIDEIHEQMNKSNFNVIYTAKPFSVIGLTATLGLSKKPVRMKAFSLAGPVLYSYPLTRGMQENVLSKGLVIQVLYNNSIEDIKAYSSTSAYDELIVRNPERNWIISNIIRKAERSGKYTIVLVERLKHLSRLSHRLEKKGVVHKIVSGTFRGGHISVSTRMVSKEKFEQGKVRVILANKVFKKGIDIKRVDVIVNAAGRKGKDDAIQIFGRGVRKHADKLALLLFDISDVDIFDGERKKKNWLAAASKSRRRAYLKAGITVRKFEWNDDVKDLFKQAGKWLQQEIK